MRARRPQNLRPTNILRHESKVKQSLVSFGDDDDGAESLHVVVAAETKKSKKKKGKDKEKKRGREDEEDEKRPKRVRPAITTTTSALPENEDEWVEKTPPPLAPGPTNAESLRLGPKDSHRPNRPKASDFM